MNDNDLNMVAVIMAGGSGTRFWPLSTERRPKQFIALLDDRTLLQKSCDRLRGILPPERILVITNDAYVNLAKEQLPEIPAVNIIGEPARRDTAAAVCLSAAIAKKRFGNPVVITVTADHIIEPVEQFRKTVLSAAKKARESNALYTFAIKPTFPATGYGYLEMSESLGADSGIAHFRVARFKEKPNREMAQIYFTSGRHFWNSGMFAWNSDAILEEMRTHLFDHYHKIVSAVEYESTAAWPEKLREAFQDLESISIDYAVMEKATDVRCVAAEFMWSDVGGWIALKDFLQCDDEGNHFKGKVHTYDASGNIVFSDDPNETLMLIGVDDIVAVRAGGKTLIADKNRIEDIKKVVNMIERFEPRSMSTSA
ncbi:MAG: Mannose-1-phosphate guanylyltransferase 1 [bacterium ADurb.Bin236]|nr:MAG: Mannose-1-phosphate guanylyltransferase 1 [bacterium ADurb.Bin236]